MVRKLFLAILGHMPRFAAMGKAPRPLAAEAHRARDWLKGWTHGGRFQDNFISRDWLKI